MLVDIDVPVRFKIDSSVIPQLYSVLLMATEIDRKNNKPRSSLDALTEAVGEKLQYLKDRKLLIADIKQQDKETNKKNDTNAGKVRPDQVLD